MAEFHNPDTIWQPFGAFSMMVIEGAGRTVRLKGQVSLDGAGEIVGAYDMRAQVRQVLSNIEKVLSSVGGRMCDVIELVHSTTDIDAFMQTGDIRQHYFSAPYPITTTVEVAKLYDPNLVIEITATAEIPLDRFVAPEKTS